MSYCFGETPRWRLNTSVKFGFLNFDNISIKIGWMGYLFIKYCVVAHAHIYVHSLPYEAHTQSTKLFMIRLLCTTFQKKISPLYLSIIPDRITAAASHTKIQKVFLVGSDLITGCIITNLAT